MIYVFLADGFEEAEALVTVDILRRAGKKVTCVGVDKKEIVGAHGIKVTADIKTGEFAPVEFEGVVLPGGMPGTKNLMANATVCSAAKSAYKKGKLVGAICAAPAVLGNLGILKGKAATCYPGFEDRLTGAAYVPDLRCRFLYDAAQSLWQCPGTEQPAAAADRGDDPHLPGVF